MTTHYSFTTSDGRAFHAISDPLPRTYENIRVEFNVVGPETNATVVFHMSELTADEIRGTGFSEPMEDWLRGFGFETIKNSADDGPIIDGDYYVSQEQTTPENFVGSKLSDLITP